MIGNKREIEINNFLKRLAKKAKHENVSNGQIYYELNFNNLSPDKRVDLSVYFDYWQQVFANDEKTKVYVQKDWDSFCQFVDKNVYYSKPNVDPVKIYVALKPDRLALGANQIFKFLSDNNIRHRSKIGRILRDDNIVIRVYDLKDAKRLISFINNNKFLVDGHIPVSPFCFHEGIVGLAVDNFLSYNSVVCWLISKYLEEKKILKQLNRVSCKDLCNFVDNFDLMVAFNNKQIPENIINNVSDVMFVEEIRKLFVKSLRTNDMNEFYRHYFSVSKNQHLINNNERNNMYTSNNQKQISRMLSDLLSVMQGTASKYDDSWVYNALRMFLMNGNMCGFTRIDAFGKACRSILVNHNFHYMRLEIYKDMIGINEFGNQTLPEFTQERIDELVDYFYNTYFKKNKDYLR